MDDKRTTDVCRPCIVNGQKALFHRWSDKERVILKFDSMLNSVLQQQILDTFKNTNTVPVGVSTERVKPTVAIVEFEGGDIEEVVPTEVKFLDTEKFFFENELFFKQKEPKKLHFSDLMAKSNIIITKDYDQMSGILAYQFYYKGKRFVRRLNRQQYDQFNEDLEDAICREAKTQLGLIDDE